ncbi:MAG: tRNA uridine-5-carboxymethylaminomethyl(34) synthesis enzyme MnmG [Erysipelotrichaceae bacterium]|nr:tRNA uridine-5-carboxymethylaminomethyl(34) synthesis enzyme MnmG [Erysipelotrichaceae bacterium]
MFDCLVVGAGHAGCEAAYALAKMNFKTALITLSLEHIAKMPCNPSVGGPAKGIVVREIDAFGGLMPRVADETALQFKMLNSSKGPGVRALRVQSDKLAYSKLMYKYLSETKNLTIIEDLVTGINVENGRISGVKLEGGDLSAKAVILTTGTYMDSITMISSSTKSEGPDGQRTTKDLSASLKSFGLELFRLKTGTPPRILTSSINFSKTALEPGSKGIYKFSDTTDIADILPFEKQWPCYLTHTTSETKKIIEANLNKSSMYSGVVKGVGPRYCPSIEDKIVRFNDKEVHQIFLEPEAIDLDTTYVQGFSSSLPCDVQEKMLHTVTGLENAIIKKYAYAIEYDAINPLNVKINLETKPIENLFIAGQILGTSGYEEAAGLGLMAAINCARKLKEEEPFILRRDESYIGLMIDDLITKGTNEPYRLLTSRAEYRLLLRHDNADQRLLTYGYELGLVDQKRYDDYLKKMDDLARAKEVLRNIKINRHSEVDNYLKSLDYDELSMGQSAYELLKRPKISLSGLKPYCNFDIAENIFSQIEIEIKYEGYIEKAKKDAQRMIKMEKLKLDANLDYNEVANLSLEARQKLNKIKPMTLGQASRVSGINPSDLEVIAIHIKGKRGK